MSVPSIVILPKVIRTRGARCAGSVLKCGVCDLKKQINLFKGLKRMKEIDLDKYLDYIPKCSICGEISTPYYCLRCDAKYCCNCHSNLKMKSSEYYDIVHGCWIPTVVTVCKKCGGVVAP